MTSPTLTGACTCGRISYTSTAEPEHLDYCYCLTCQQSGGGPFVAWMGVPRDALQWHGDEAAVYRATVGSTGASIAERTFCRACGSNLTMQYDFYPHKAHVAAGTIRRSDFDPPRVGCHIWCSKAPAWYAILEDGVERQAEFGDDFQVLIDKYLEERGVSV